MESPESGPGPSLVSRVWAEPGRPRRSQLLSCDSSLAEFLNNISPHGLNTESGPHAKCFTRFLSSPITALSMRECGDRSSGQFRELFQVIHFLYHGTRTPYVQRSFKILSNWPSGTMTHQNGWIRATVMEEGAGDPLFLECGEARRVLRIGSGWPGWLGRALGGLRTMASPIL